MNVFEAVKGNVITRQAAEFYGIRVQRNGMTCCPFHADRTPSMKVDRRFHCFGCGADGDVIDFVYRLFDLPCREATVKLADDFGISYDNSRKRNIRPHVREPTAEQKYQKEETHCYRVLTEYFNLLLSWERKYAPDSRRKNGIRCLWKSCKERTISNICLILCCLVLWRNEKPLLQNREKR